MAADGGWNKPSREQGPAEARRAIKVPLLYHRDRHSSRILEGCPANHAALLLEPSGPDLSTHAVNCYVWTAGPRSPDRNFVTDLLNSLIAFVSAHAWLAYLTLFLAALLEAVPLVGSVIPGSTVILALSALVPGGELKLWPVLAAAITGALLGDGAAYWTGHRSQREILGTWPLTNYPRVIKQSEAFFNRWGALAVFFARFVPPIRAFVPITAGALGMPPARFYAVNIPAVLLWAVAHVLPGVLAVSALHRYAGLPHHEHVGKHLWILAMLGGALILALAIWTIRRRHGGGVIDPAPKRI